MEDTSLAIRQFNDRFRRSAGGGLLHVSPGVQKLGTKALRQIVRNIRIADRFRANQLAPDLHEAGVLDYNGHRIFWKIEPFNRTSPLEVGSISNGKSDASFLRISFLKKS